LNWYQYLVSHLH